MKAKLLGVIVCMAIAQTSGMLGAGFRLDMVTVDGPGNEPDHNGYGAVSYVFLISSRNITNRQYAEFLNAVDAKGENRKGLYHPEMTSSGCINFEPGAREGRKYRAVPGAANEAACHVGWADAARFANWLSNGGRKGSSTEVGAYNLIKSEGKVTEREAGARYWVPRADELYKASHYLPTGKWLSQTRVFYAGEAKKNARPAIVLSLVNNLFHEVVDTGSVPASPRRSYLRQAEDGLEVPFAFSGAVDPGAETAQQGFRIAGSPERSREREREGAGIFYAGAPMESVPWSFPFSGAGGGRGSGAASVNLPEPPPPAS